MKRKVSFNDLSKVVGGNKKGSSSFTHFTTSQVAMLDLDDMVSVLRNDVIYQCRVYMKSTDDGQTIDVCGGGLPDDLRAARFDEVGPAGQM